jgi:hypothetical protein
MSGYDFQTDSIGDPEENLWTILQPGSSVSSNAAFSFSPASLPGSMSSWAMINSRNRQTQPSLSGALSPLDLDFDQSASFPSSNYGDMGTGYNVTSAPAEGQFTPGEQSYIQSSDSNGFDDATFNATFNPDIGENQHNYLTQAQPLTDLQISLPFLVH